MVKQEKQATPAAEKPKAKRTMLTPEERIAKLEADLKAAREKAEARANKGRDKALEQRAKLVAKRDEITAKIEAIDAEFPPAEAEPVSEPAG